jgi:cytidyltransferase-like protein
LTELPPLPASVRRATIVSGYFNPLHIGHLDMMEAARSLADALVVIVNNDAQQVLKKGKVITSETDRLRIVEALRVTDAALVAVDEDGAVAASL